MNVIEILEDVKKRAKTDIEFRQRLIATKEADKPLEAFCRLCREVGFELYEMEVIDAGEEFYATMRRSTNGGGENSPKLKGEDDYYELFIAELES